MPPTIPRSLVVINDRFARFYPNSLRVARDFRGHGVGELAELAGVSRRTVSLFENGEGEFSEPALRALAAVLRFPYGFFFEPVQVPDSDVLHFRKNASVPGYAIAKAQAHAALFMKAIAIFRSIAPFASPRLPSRPPVLSAEMIEKLGLDFRAAVGIDSNAPIANATAAVEAAGVSVGIFDPQGTPIHGFAFAGQSKIVLLSTASSWSRRRLSVLHEAGHLIMHTEPGQSKEREVQASRFAGAVLVPRAAFFREFPRPSRYRFNWPALIAMKQRWGISIQAIVHRAHDLQLIDDAQFRTAFIHISHSGWRTSEPAEQQIEEPAVSSAFIAALRSAGRQSELRSDSFAPENLSEALGVSVNLDEEEEKSRGVALSRRK